MTIYPITTPVGKGWIGLYKQVVVWLSLGPLDEEALKRYWKGPTRKGKRCPLPLSRLVDAVKGNGSVEIAPMGTLFQQKVWDQLMRIPFSTTTSYGEIAERLGSARQARAVGAAVGANPIAWLIPCHRVLPASGETGAYRWGPETKRKLLEWESAQSAKQDGEELPPETRRKLEAMLMKAQRFEDIARMSGDIAHDLNNLLAPIRMATQLLKRKLQDPSLDRYVEIIETSTGRARSVIQDILTFSKETEGTERERIDIVPHLKELEKLAKETFPKRIQFKFDCGKNLPEVYMDHNQFHRAILNLLINARDAMEGKGRISLCATLHDLDMKVCVGDKCLVPGRFICISVSDTGCGIPEDIRESIFDPFFTTKPKEQGTGLGLASVYGIIAKSGGFIDLESEVGKGTTFHIYIPQAGDA